jgi:hypothetical protein
MTNSNINLEKMKATLNHMYESAKSMAEVERVRALYRAHNIEMPSSGDTTQATKPSSFKELLKKLRDIIFLAWLSFIGAAYLTIGVLQFLKNINLIKF